MNAIDIGLSLLLTTQGGQKSTGVQIIVKLNHVFSRGQYLLEKFKYNEYYKILLLLLCSF